ncbi:MAG: histone acetyltransferase [Xanthomonadaceae bacterium]|nr:histone acetyltransferase [Xanthomonadaceae bacterium]
MRAADWIPACAASAAIDRYRPAEYRVKLATEAWELREARSLRRAVFCAEQRLFAFTDSDDIDDGAGALTLVAVSCIHSMSEDVVGTVRVHTLGDGVWQGSRLAVRRDYRGQAWLGSELIHLAVSLAHARGAQRFLAHVQQQNVALFERLHWRALEAIELRGRPHLRMEADLAHYPPCDSVERGFITTLRSAA